MSEPLFELSTASEVKQVKNFQESLAQLDKTLSTMDSSSLNKLTKEIDKLAAAKTQNVQSLGSEMGMLKQQLENLKKLRGDIWADSRNQSKRSLYADAVQATIKDLDAMKNKVATTLATIEAAEKAHLERAAARSQRAARNMVRAATNFNVGSYSKVSTGKAVGSLPEDQFVGPTKSQWEAYTSKLAAEQAEAVKRAVRMVKRATNAASGAFTTLEGMGKGVIPADLLVGPSKAAWEAYSTQMAEQEAASVKRAIRMVKRATNAASGAFTTLEGVGKGLIPAELFEGPSKAAWEAYSSDMAAKEAAAVKRAVLMVKRATNRASGAYTTIEGADKGLIPADLFVGPSKSAWEAYTTQVAADEAAAVKRAVRMVKRATNAATGAFTTLEGVGKGIVPADLFVGPSKSAWEAYSSQVAADEAAAVKRAVSMVKRATNRASGAYTTLDGADKGLIPSDLFVGPSKDQWEAYTAKMAAEEAAAVKRAMRMVRRATTNAAGDFTALDTGKFTPLKLPKATAVADVPEAPKNLGQLIGGLKLFEASSKDATAGARGLAQSLGVLTSGFSNLLPYLGGAALGAGVKSIVTLGAEVDNTMETIRVLSQESAASMTGLNTQMLELGRNGPFGPLEVAKAMKTLSLAGLDASQITSSLKDVLNFAVAGDTSIEKAADVMTSVATAFSYSAEGYNYVGDVIAKTAAVSKSSVDSIGEAFKTASVINKQYGVSLEDVGTGLALLSNLGIQGTAAGVALRNMYVDLSGRTPKVSGAIKKMGLDLRDANGDFVDLVTMMQRLDTALAQMGDNIQKKNALKDLLSERGGKPVIEGLDLIQRKAKETGTTAANMLQEMQQKIAQSAGFVVIAASEMALTPMNQMKSVAATLETTVVETFKTLEPTILAVSTRLKEIFNSAEFKNGLASTMSAIAQLTTFFVEHLDVVGKIAIAYTSLKVAQLAVAGFTGMATGIAALNAALTSTGAASTAAAAGTAAVGTATAATVTTLSRVLGIINPIIGVLTLAGTAWFLYKTYVDSANKSQEAVATSGYSEALVKQLQSETERLNENTAAMRENISVEQLRARKAITQNASSSTVELDSRVMAAQRDVNQAKKALDDATAMADRNGTRNNVEGQIYLQSFEGNVQASIAKLNAVKEQRRIVELDLIHARGYAVAAAANNADEVKAQNKRQVAEAKAQADLLKGQNPYVGSKPKPKFQRPEFVERDRSNEIAEYQKQQDLLMGEMKNASDNKLRLLESGRQANAISEGRYRAEQLAETRAYEASALQALETSMAEQVKLYGEKWSKLQKQLGEKDTPEGKAKVQTELDNAYNALQTAIDKNNGERAKIADTAMTRMQIAAQKTTGYMRSLAKTSQDYWDSFARSKELTSKADAIAEQYRFLNESIFSFDVARKASAEAALDEEARHADMLLKMGSDLEYMIELRQDYVGTYLGRPLDKEEQAELADLDLKIAKLREIKELTEGKVKKAVDDAGDRGAKLARQRQIDGFAGDLAGAVMTGLKDGAEAGKKKFRDVIFEHLISKPFEIEIKATISELLGGLMGGGGGADAAGANAGGGIIGQGTRLLNTGKNLYSLYQGLTGYSPAVANASAFFGGGSTVGANSLQLGYANAVQAGGGDGLGAFLGATDSWNGVSVGGSALGAGGLGAAGYSLATGGTAFGTAAATTTAASSLGSGAGMYALGTGSQAVAGGLGLNAAGGVLGGGLTASGTVGGAASVGAGIGAGGAGGATGGAAAGSMAGLSATGWGAIIAVAVLAIMSMVGGGKGPKITGGYNNTDKPEQVNHITMAPDGGTYGGPLDDFAKKMVTSTEERYKELVADFGGTEGKITSTAFVGKPSLKGDVQLHQSTYLNGELVYNRFQNEGGSATNPKAAENVGRSEEEIAAAVQEAQTKAIIGALLKSGLSEEVTKYLGSIDLKTATQAQMDFAIERAKAYSGFINVIKTLPFENLKTLSMDAADELVRMAGGLDAFNSRLTAYYEGYYTEGERTAVKTAQVSDAFKKLGMTMPSLEQPADQARAAFRALVEAQDVSTEAGRKNYNSLMSLSTAFADLTPLADSATKTIKSSSEILSERQGLEGQILTLQGKTAELRAIERAQLDKTNQALYDTVKILEDLAEVANEQRSLEDQMLELMGATEEIRKRKLAGMHEENRSMQIAIWDLEDKRKAEQAAADAAAEAADKQRTARDKAFSVLEKSVNAEIKIREDQLAAANKTRDSLKSLFDYLADQVRDLYDSVLGTKPEAVLDSQGIINDAVATSANGGVVDQDKLSKAITSVRATLVSENFSSQFEQDKATILLANKLAFIQGNTGKAIDKEDATIALLELQIKDHQKVIDFWKEAIEKADGTYVAVISVVDAINNLGKIMSGGGAATPAPGGAAANPPGSPSNPVIGKTPGSGASFGGSNKPDSGTNLYKYNEVIGSYTGGTSTRAVTDPSEIARLDKLSGLHAAFNGTGDLTGLFTTIKNAGGTLKDLQTITGIGTMDDWRASAASVNFPAFAKGTDYVPHDMIAQIHKGEKIVPAPYNRSDISNDQLGQVIGELVSVVQNLLVNNTSENRAMADKLGNISRLLNNLAPRGDALEVRIRSVADDVTVPTKEVA